MAQSNQWPEVYRRSWSDIRAIDRAYQCGALDAYRKQLRDELESELDDDGTEPDVGDIDPPGDPRPRG